MENKKQKTIGIGLLFLEVYLLFALFSFVPSGVIAGIGIDNTTVDTWLQVGNVFPDILNVTINNDNAITLTPNATTLVSCVAVIRDYNGDSDIAMVNATFYDSASSSEAVDDNNDHYSNSSCERIAGSEMYKGWNLSDDYHSLANCTFEVEYYANADPNWVCNVTVEDNLTWSDTKWNTEEISTMLALGLPNVINYTKVNATEVSPEQVANVTNFGNVQFNLSLESYGVTRGDGFAMNCTLGNIGTIDAMYQKYNLTNSTLTTPPSLSDFELTYINMTSTGAPEIRQFELASRTNDTVNEAIKPTYWRIYVPKGVAGQCTGKIIFGANPDVGI